MDMTVSAYQHYIDTWISLDRAIEVARELEAAKAPAKAIRGAWDHVAKLQGLKDHWKAVSDAEFAAEEAAEEAAFEAEQAAAVAAAEAIIAGKVA